MLRGRSIQLADALKEDSAEFAVTEMMKTLKSEGINSMEIEESDARKVAEFLRPNLENKSEEVKRDLLTYHILIWKTAQPNTWTLKREPEALEVVPYLPAILQATALPMSAEVCTAGEYMAPQERRVSEEVKECIGENDYWQEISVLEYVNASLPADKINRAEGPTSQPVVPVKVIKDRDLSWRVAEDSDIHLGEDIFETDSGDSYVRTYSDPRVSYESRPDALKNMRFGQLVSQYRIVWPSDHGYEKAKNTIDDITMVGPDSDVMIAGTLTAAPMTFMLKNGKIMKRRQDGTAVPQLLHSGTTSKHSNQLLWTAWDKLEDVNGDQDEDETDDQKRIRLQVFPFSRFPFIEGDSDVSDDDIEEH